MNSTPTRLTIISILISSNRQLKTGAVYGQSYKEGQKPPPPFLPSLPSSDHPARGRVPAGLRRADSLAPTLRTRARPDAATADCRFMIHFTKKDREAAPAFSNRLRTPRPGRARPGRSFTRRYTHTDALSRSPHRSQPPKGTYLLSAVPGTSGFVQPNYLCRVRK